MTPNPDPPVTTEVPACPECGAPMEKTQGMWVCPECGEEEEDPEDE